MKSVGVYVCVYLYMFMCMHVCVCVYMFMCVFVCICVYICLCLCVCVCTYFYVYVCMFVVCVCVCVCMFVYMCVCLCGCMCVYVRCVCMCMYMFMLHIKASKNRQEYCILIRVMGLVANIERVMERRQLVGFYLTCFLSKGKSVWIAINILSVQMNSPLLKINSLNLSFGITAHLVLGLLWRTLSLHTPSYHWSYK